MVLSRREAILGAVAAAFAPKAATAIPRFIKARWDFDEGDDSNPNSHWVKAAGYADIMGIVMAMQVHEIMKAEDKAFLNQLMAARDR